MTGQILSSVLLFSAMCHTAKAAVLPTPYQSSLTAGQQLPRGCRFTAFPIAFAPEVTAFKADNEAELSPKGRPVRIVLRTGFSEEQYRLKLGKEIVIEASTPTGVAWALSTLSQVLDTMTPLKGVIDDLPQVSFRALTVDVARRYHSLSTLRSLVRWCEAGKVRYMQLHLTDDQNWMFPSDLLLGIDSKNSSGHPAYTKPELQELQSFASDRGVTLIPEIDIPGHSALLVALDRNTYGLKGSPSANCINFGSPTVREHMKAVLKEAINLFPKSPYVHIGGDEAWYPDADKDPQVAQSMARQGLSTQDLFANFVGDMARYVIGKGKTPLIWEGFAASPSVKRFIPQQSIIVAWDGSFYPAKQLTVDGFRVVNAGWDPYYVVNHFPYDVNTMVPLEHLYHSTYKRFASVADKADAFNWQNPELVVGSMLCWWEGREWNALQLLPLRILAFGARMWNPDGEQDYSSFLARSSRISVQMEHQLYPFRLQLTGGLAKDPTRFETQLNVESCPYKAGTQIGIRIDGQSPTMADLKLKRSISLKDSAVLSIQAFRKGHPEGETLLLPVKKIRMERNLAFGMPMSTQGETDPQFPPTAVTNGVSADPTNYWLAFSNPQFLTIDLRKPTLVSRVEVVAEWLSGDPTKYMVDVSQDGKLWRHVVDASKQTAPSAAAGYVHRFEPSKARYIRMQTLGGALYPPTMTRICQIRVYGP